jgi:hypothetical protein
MPQLCRNLILLNVVTGAGSMPNDTIRGTPYCMRQMLHPHSSSRNNVSMDYSNEVNTKRGIDDVGGTITVVRSSRGCPIAVAATKWEDTPVTALNDLERRGRHSHLTMLKCFLLGPTDIVVR